MVVLDGDPLDDPYAMEKVELVVRDGRLYRPGEINLPVEVG